MYLICPVPASGGVNSPLTTWGARGLRGGDFRSPASAKRPPLRVPETLNLLPQQHRSRSTSQRPPHTRLMFLSLDSGVAGGFFDGLPQHGSQQEMSPAPDLGLTSPLASFSKFC